VSLVRWRTACLLLFTLALALRVGWVWHLPATLTWEDEKQFVEIAHHLAAGDGYVSDSYRANPALPFLLGLIFRIFGESYLVARIVQGLLGALTCLLLCDVGERLVDRATGILAGFWLALYLPHIYLAGFFYAEALATFAVVLALDLAVRAVEGQGRRAVALAAGAGLGFAGLTRPVLLMCAPAIVLAWLLGGDSPTGGRTMLRRRLALTLTLAAGFLLTILPWTVRNFARYHRLIPVSSGFYTKLWQGNSELSDGGPDDRELMWGTAEWEERLARLEPAARASIEARYAAVDARYEERRAALGDRVLASDDVLKPVILAEIRSRPWRFLGLMAKKTLTFYSAFSSTLTQNEYTRAAYKILAAVSFYPLLILAAAGAWMGWPDRRRLAPVYLVVAAVTLAYAALNTCTRFRLPIDPCLMLFGSLAATRIGRRVLRSRSIPAR